MEGEKVTLWAVLAVLKGKYHAIYSRRPQAVFPPHTPEHPTRATTPPTIASMGNDDRSDVIPDSTLLKHMFGEHQPSSVSIILQNWDKCIFSATFTIASPLENGQHSCVVRLEALDNDHPPAFALVAATQEIAATCIPLLVPATL